MIDVSPYVSQSVVCNNACTASKETRQEVIYRSCGCESYGTAHALGGKPRPWKRRRVIFGSALTKCRPEFLGKQQRDAHFGILAALEKNIPPSPRQSCRTTMSAPQASLSDLRRADGSATFSQNGYSVLCAVNGPLEVQRRDELPEEAAIEVNVRPASGVGSKHALSYK